jgi:hypothetical protein
MPRVPHHDGRSAVVLVLSAVLLLIGALAGVQSAASEPVDHTDLHRTTDLDLGTLAAVVKSHSATHPQRPDVHASGVLVPRSESADAWFPVAASSASVVPVCAACQVPLGGRAPPA